MNTLRKDLITSYLLLFVTIVLWASAFVGIRIGLKSYTPGTLALLRFSIASIAITPLYFKYRSIAGLTTKERLLIFFLGFLGIFPSVIAYITWSMALAVTLRHANKYVFQTRRDSLPMMCIPFTSRNCCL